MDRDGRVQTQRLKRRLAAVRPALDLAAETLTLETEGMEALRLPLRAAAATGCSPARAFMGHGDPAGGIPVWQYPAEATEWLTRCLAGAPGLTINGAERPPRSKDRGKRLRTRTCKSEIPLESATDNPLENATDNPR